MSSNQPAETELPRLCYLGSLQVEATSASMMLLYRLLETYPSDRLQVIFAKEDDRLPERPDRRLKNVIYHELRPLFTRGWYFTRMRLPRLHWLMLRAHAWWQARRAARLLGAFRPDFVITIHEQFGWLTGVQLSHRLGVPYHLFLHDDWFRNLPMAGVLRSRFDAAFKQAYRDAASRLCISPYMEADYARRFGASGTVLYPSRSHGAPVFPPDPLSGPLTPASGLRVAYGGNIFHRGYWEALQHLADALAPLGGRLLIFGPSPADVEKHGLKRPHVVACGFVNDMARAMREQSDVLFLPMTFEEKERPNMQVSFPSKLAEYTAAGRPVLIYGPEYCSAVRWARENPQAAEVVDQPGVDGLRTILERLTSAAHRHDLATHALEAGSRYFSFESAFAIFLSALRGSR